MFLTTFNHIHFLVVGKWWSSRCSGANKSDSFLSTGLKLVWNLKKVQFLLNDKNSPIFDGWNISSCGCGSNGKRILPPFLHRWLGWSVHCTGWAGWMLLWQRWSEAQSLCTFSTWEIPQIKRIDITLRCCQIIEILAHLLHLLTLRKGGLLKIVVQEVPVLLLLVCWCLSDDCLSDNDQLSNNRFSLKWSKLWS